MIEVHTTHSRTGSQDYVGVKHHKHSRILTALVPPRLALDMEPDAQLAAQDVRLADQLAAQQLRAGHREVTARL